MAIKTKSGKSFKDHLKDNGLEDIEKGLLKSFEGPKKAINSFVIDSEWPWDDFLLPPVNYGFSAITKLIDKIHTAEKE